MSNPVESQSLRQTASKQEKEGDPDFQVHSRHFVKATPGAVTKRTDIPSIKKR